MTWIGSAGVENKGLNQLGRKLTKTDTTNNYFIKYQFSPKYNKVYKYGPSHHPITNLYIHIDAKLLLEPYLIFRTIFACLWIKNVRTILILFTTILFFVG